MPVRPPLLQDPPLPVVQGDQLLSSVLPSLGLPVPLPAGEQPPLSATKLPLVVENRVVVSIVPEIAPTPYRTLAGGEMRAANAGIATPTGEWIPMQWLGITLNPFTQATTRFAFIGVTRDNALAALGGCTVRAFDMRHLALGDTESEVGETVSDGSGNYTLYVGSNTPHQLVAYLAGSPDRAGVSANTVVPGAAG